MRIAFSTTFLVLDRDRPDGFRAECKTLDSSWDWHPLRVALVLGAVWHARTQSRLRQNRPAKREAYAAVADAICAMLHRLGDVERYIDYDGLPAERERHPHWVMQSGLNCVVRDIETWVETGVPQYRVSSWAPQWEALRSACTALEGYGEHADSALFSAVLDLEALERVGTEHTSGPRHAAIIALCGTSAKIFKQHPRSQFMAEPPRRLARHLIEVSDEYHLRYSLVEIPPGAQPVACPDAAISVTHP